jgi:flagellar basal body P-ring formation protein FlgA
MIMNRIAAAVAFFSLAISATSSLAQSPDGARNRVAIFSERFAGDVSGQPVPSHVKSALPPSITGPRLRAEAVVATDLVRIGDLIDNAGITADIAIFRAPDLGQTGSVLASRIVEAVRPHKILDLDTRGITEVAVTRASRTIDQKDIEARILRALSGQHGITESSNLAVTFDNEVRALQIDPSLNLELRVLRFTFEPRTGRFDVSFEYPGNPAPRRPALRYTGTIAETFEAAVPTRTIAPGEILNKSNLMITRRPKNEFAADVVLEVAQAIGRSARRGLRAGQAIRMNDLVKAEIIQRNENVTITYEVPGIMLTMHGQALEAGALGDAINVLNVQSKKSIRATIAGPGHVVVAARVPLVLTPPPRVAADAAAAPSSNSNR